MIIFAWILWGLILLGWSFSLALLFCAFSALRDETKTVNFRINLFDVLLTIAIFVFLSLYLFL